MCYGVPTGGIGYIRELAFDPRADVNDDGVVNVIDLATVAHQLASRHQVSVNDSAPQEKDRTLQPT